MIKNEKYSIHIHEGKQKIPLCSVCTMVTIWIANGYDFAEVGFRPIVCLKSNVALESVSEGVYKIK